MKQMYLAACLLLLLSACGLKNEPMNAESKLIQENKDVKEKEEVVVKEDVESKEEGTFVDAQDDVKQEEDEPQESKEINEQKLIDEQKDLLTGFETVKEVHLTSTDIPNLVSICHDEIYSHLRIESYNPVTNMWETVYTKDDHEHYGIEKFKLLETAMTQNGLEQAAVGYHAGSGGYLNVLIFGLVEQGGVDVLFDGMYKDYYQANIHAKTDHWEIVGEKGLLETIPF